MRILIALLCLGVSLCAKTLVFSTAANSVNPKDNQPVMAVAEFDMEPGRITITLQNLLDNPRAISQGLSGLAFTLSDGTSTLGASLESSSASRISVAKNGTTSPPKTGPTGWALKTSGTTLELCVLCTTVGPARILLGEGDASGVYSNANGSIAGAKQHNPFLQAAATFVLTAPLVTAATRIRETIFYFGSDGQTLDAVNLTHNPEPGSMFLLGGGLAGLVLLSLRHARQMGASVGLRGTARGGSGRPVAAPPGHPPDTVC